VFVALQEQNKAIEENKIKNKEMSFGSAKRWNLYCTFGPKLWPEPKDR
jgi:hypothetical protein